MKFLKTFESYNLLKRIFFDMSNENSETAVKMLEDAAIYFDYDWKSNFITIHCNENQFEKVKQILDPGNRDIETAEELTDDAAVVIFIE